MTKKFPSTLTRLLAAVALVAALCASPVTLAAPAGADGPATLQTWLTDLVSLLDGWWSVTAHSDAGPDMDPNGVNADAGPSMDPDGEAATAGPSMDPNGGESDAGGSMDPNG